MQGIPPGWTLLVHVAVAVIYTTPWDNYLVASGVWAYADGLVAGITLGWVPLEEYLFFIVQSLIVGPWLIWLARRLDRNPAVRPVARPVRVALLTGVLLLWLAAALSLAHAHQPTHYLSLQLIWALPPVALQLAFGLESIIRRWRLASTAILAPTAYLALADTVPLSSGTWSIAPSQSLGVMLLGSLPLEELTFFLMTNILLVFGMILFMASESPTRARQLARRLPFGRAT